MSYRFRFFPSRSARQVFLLLLSGCVSISTLLSIVLISLFDWHRSHQVSAAVHPWAALVLLSVLIALLCLVVLLVFCVRRLAVPTGIFAQAVTSLNMDLQVQVLEEVGSAENRQAIRAFNELKMRIAALLEERTQMIAAVSHDLRTPITRLKLRAEHYLEPPLVDKFLSDLQEMESLVQQVLDYSQQANRLVQRVPVDLTALLHDLCQQLIEIGCDVRFDKPTQQHFALVDPLMVKQGLANLVTNAVKYGEVALVRIGQQGQQIFIEIDDQGPGIPAEALAKIFIPFYRVDPSRSTQKGVGLGLAIARQAIVVNDGQLDLANLPDQGLRARVVFSHYISSI